MIFIKTLRALSALYVWTLKFLILSLESSFRLKNVVNTGLVEDHPTLNSQRQLFSSYFIIWGRKQGSCLSSLEIEYIRMIYFFSKQSYQFYSISLLAAQHLSQKYSKQIYNGKYNYLQTIGHVTANWISTDVTVYVQIYCLCP